MTRSENAWVVLRCRGRDTFELSEDLASIGLRAFTPAVRTRMRLPRQRKVALVTRPALPSFVFVGDEASTQAQIARDKGRTPQFSMMRWAGDIMRVSDAALRPLKRLSAGDDISALGARGRAHLLPGEQVVILGGPFVGRLAKVTGWDGAYNQIQLEENPLRIRITPFLLRLADA